MIGRIAVAYGAVQALAGSVVFVVVGAFAVHHTLGMTRQPLPLTWPLAILHVVVAQLPLREILGPGERVARRSAQARACRAGLSLCLLTAGLVTYVSANDDHALTSFFLILASAGFWSATVGRVEAWVVPMAGGFLLTGLAYLTPWGRPIDRFLLAVPVPAGLGLLGVAIAWWVLQEWLPGSPSPARG